MDELLAYVHSLYHQLNDAICDGILGQYLDVRHLPVNFCTYPLNCMDISFGVFITWLLWLIYFNLKNSSRVGGTVSPDIHQRQ